MEGDLRSALDFEVAADGGGDGGGDDAKVLAGLSTVLVATIQEVKDRISHIEFLFCSQLFPRIQSRPRALQRRLSAAGTGRAAAGEWGEKEASPLRQIEELRLGKHRAEEEWGKREGSLLCQIEELRLGKQRAEEEWGKREGSLLCQIEELRLGKQRAEEEWGKSEACLLGQIEELRGGKQRAEEEWGKREGSLLRQIEELRLGKQRAEEEARRLAASVERDGAEAAAQHEAEKALLLEKVESAERAKETAVAELKEQLRGKAEELAESRGLQDDLLEQVDRTEMDLEEEKKKRKQLAYGCAKLQERYKNMKSQYCFLLRKTGLTPDPKDGADGEACSPASLLPNKRKSSQDPETRDEGGNSAAAKRDGLEENGGVREKEQSSNAASSSDPLTANLKPKLLGGPKSTLPSWVHTRTRQDGRGIDPHDDFLDTPMQNIRENLRKMPDDEPHGIPSLASNDENLNDFDGETKEVDNVPSAQKPQISVLKPEKRSFKHVQPVRKKAEREKLKGVECKQCKKFYDAVLPDDRGKGEVRCEHHEGVSRHRYNYIPPMTPEGFWNIGFDSEL